MKIAKFIIQNFKALKGDHTFEPHGNSFFVVGANGVGKSSITNILIEILTKDLPQTPVTTGEKSGFVQITLTDGKQIFYRFEDGEKPKLELITSDDIRVENPTEIFKTLAGTGMTFDINEFLDLAPQPKREMLEKLVGVDFTEINEREKKATEHATDLNRRFKDERAKIEPFDETLLTTEKIIVADVSQQLQDAMTAKAKFDAFADQIANRANQIETIETQVKQLQKRIYDLNDERNALTAEQNELVSSIIPETAMNALREQIAKADEHNKSIDAAIKAKEQFDYVKKLESDVEMTKMNIKNIRAEKQKLIADNPLPATGMTFDEDGKTILLDGLPFEDNQIATSRKMIAALEIAEHMLGKIKFLSFDASILDKENAMRVLDFAESKGLQLGIERALWDGGELKFEVVENTGDDKPVKCCRSGEFIVPKPIKSTTAEHSTNVH